MKKLINIIPESFLKDYKVINYELNFEFIGSINVIFEDKNNFKYSLILPRYKKFPNSLGLEHAIDKNEYFKYLANKIHKNYYNYSKIEYINSSTKIDILCPVHGIIRQTPNSHLNGSGCVICKYKDIKDKNIIGYKNDFINKASKIHENKYDYSLVEYKTAKDKVKIICPVHGVFEQIPDSHINKNGCPKCGNLKIGNKLRKQNTDYIEQAKKVNGDKYNYSETIYEGAFKNIRIFCNLHKKFFWKNPQLHLKGSGCDLCGKESMALNGTAWNKTRWVEKSKNNKSILYVIEFYDNNERFYKIGITNKTIKERIRYIPYKFNILLQIEHNAEIIWYLEKSFHSSYKEYKYIPLKEFGGDKECYNKEIFNNLNKEKMKKTIENLVLKDNHIYKKYNGDIEKLMQQKEDITQIVASETNDWELGKLIRKIYGK